MILWGPQNHKKKYKNKDQNTVKSTNTLCIQQIFQHFLTFFIYYDLVSPQKGAKITKIGQKYTYTLCVPPEKD